MILWVSQMTQPAQDGREDKTERLAGHARAHGAHHARGARAAAWIRHRAPHRADERRPAVGESRNLVPDALEARAGRLHHVEVGSLRERPPRALLPADACGPEAARARDPSMADDQRHRRPVPLPPRGCDEADPGGAPQARRHPAADAQRHRHRRRAAVAPDDARRRISARGARRRRSAEGGRREIRQHDVSRRGLSRSARCSGSRAGRRRLPLRRTLARPDPDPQRLDDPRARAWHRRDDDARDAVPRGGFQGAAAAGPGSHREALARLRRRRQSQGQRTRLAVLVPGIDALSGHHARALRRRRLPARECDVVPRRQPPSHRRGARHGQLFQRAAGPACVGPAPDRRRSSAARRGDQSPALDRRVRSGSRGDWHVDVDRSSRATRSSAWPSGPLPARKSIPSTSGFRWMLPPPRGGTRSGSSTRA